MKTNIQVLLSKIEKKEKLPNVFFLFGNDQGIISSIISAVYNYHKKNNEVEEKTHINNKTEKQDKIVELTKAQSLFSKKNFIIISNPSEKLYESIESFNLLNNIILINGEGIKTTSKLLIFFNKHKEFYSVACYTLKKNEKINIIDIFLNKNNIKLKKEVYWFLVENISNDYLILENELKKMQLYDNKNLTVDTLSRLLIKNEGATYDEVFFMCVEKNNSNILKETRKIIYSSKESYEILANIKKFVKILVNIIEKKESSSCESLTNTYLPKYLFLKKKIFEEILKKNDQRSVSKMVALIQKTELLLRKNTSLYFEITQRFLLNFSKIIK